MPVNQADVHTAGMVWGELSIYSGNVIASLEHGVTSSVAPAINGVAIENSAARPNRFVNASATAAQCMNPGVDAVVDKNQLLMHRFL